MHTNQRLLLRILGLLVAGLVFTVAAHAADFVLMVDTSGSMNGRVSAKDQRIRISVVEQALREYLPALPQPSKVHLLAFNSGIVSEKEVLLDGPESLRQALSWVSELKSLTKRDGQTHLWTSLRKALQVATDYSEKDPDQPVIVRVLTDGEDTEKATSLEEVIHAPWPAIRRATCPAGAVVRDVAARSRTSETFPRWSDQNSFGGGLWRTSSPPNMLYSSLAARPAG